MSSIKTRGGAKEMSISAVITRADGRVENLGLISYYHRNPLKRWAVQAWIFVKRQFAVVTR
jgi:hypothetical protein